MTIAMMTVGGFSQICYAKRSHSACCDADLEVEDAEFLKSNLQYAAAMQSMSVPTDSKRVSKK